MSCGLIGSELGVPGTLGYVQTEESTSTGLPGVFSQHQEEKQNLSAKISNLFGIISLVSYLQQLSFSYLSMLWYNVLILFMKINYACLGFVKRVKHRTSGVFIPE